MRKLVIIAVIFTTISSYAQNWGNFGKQQASITPNVIVDNSELQCLYQHTVYDTILAEHKDFYEILEIGKYYSKYGNFGSYQLDSALNELGDTPITNDDFKILANKYDPSWECIIKNIQTESLKVYGKIFTDRYVYEEEIENIKWNLHKEHQIICGYECYKATTTFRGREWIAWYSDIPLSNGPWKFGNLPGLILKVEDSKQEHVFTAIMIKRDQTDFGYKKFQYFKTTRQKYNESLIEYMNESHKFFTGDLQPRNFDGSPLKIQKRKRFFNSIELE